jgi:hypothetical protein
MFPLRLEDADHVKETFKLSRLGSVLGLITSQLLHIGYRVVILSLLFISLGCVGRSY